MKVLYTPTFVRQLKQLPQALQEEVIEKVELFKKRNNYRQLKVHKLKGRLAGRYSFSVNYKIRIVFNYKTKEVAALLAVGSHAVYHS
jgi:mRNA-degrading endonuclease YafQ of YafQ-DinJ toxin-antitoxin module